MATPTGYLHVRRVHGHFWRKRWRKRYFMLDPGRRSIVYTRDALAAVRAGSFARLFCYITANTTVTACENPEGSDDPRALWVIVLEDGGGDGGDGAGDTYVALGAADEATARKWSTAIQNIVDMCKLADGGDDGGDDSDTTDDDGGDGGPGGGGGDGGILDDAAIAAFERDGFPALVAVIRGHVAKDQTPTAQAAVDRCARALARFEAQRAALGPAGVAALDRVTAAWDAQGEGEGAPEPLGALRARVAAAMVTIRAHLSELETNAGWDCQYRAKPGTKGGVSVYTKKLHEEDSFDSLKLDTVLEGDLVRLASVIAEGDLTPQWVPFCARAEMLCKPSILHGLVHMWLEFPFVMRPFISHRDLVLEGKGVDIMDKNKVLLTIRSVDDSPHCAVPEAGAGGYVRISNHGAFLFNVVTDTTVRMRVIFNMDLKLAVQPPIIVNFINRKFGPQLVGFIAKILRKYERTPFAARVRENRELYGEIEKRVAAYFAQRQAAAEAAAAGTPPRRPKKRRAGRTKDPAGATPAGLAQGLLPPVAAGRDDEDGEADGSGAGGGGRKRRPSGLDAWLASKRGGAADGRAPPQGQQGAGSRRGVVVAVAFLATCVGAALQARGNVGGAVVSLLELAGQPQLLGAAGAAGDGLVAVTPVVWLFVLGMAFFSGYLMAMSVQRV